VPSSLNARSTIARRASGRVSFHIVMYASTTVVISAMTASLIGLTRPTVTAARRRVDYP
jgi:hypothetical protein